MPKIAEAWVEFTGRFSALEKSVASIKGIASSIGPIALTIGVGAIGAGLLDAAKSAANLNETISKTKVVFGGSSGAITALADDLAERFGLVKQVTLDAASNLGLVTQAAGLTEGASAKLSVQLTKLAADASSFFNVGFDEALEKIRAGLVGESEPIRSFGVLLSEDAVAAEALALGLATSKKEIDDQAKVMARASLITKGLAKANGDLERTADSAANQIKKLVGEFENLKADFGAQLTGPLTEAIALARELGATLGSAAKAFGAGDNLGEALRSAIGGARVVNDSPSAWLADLFGFGQAAPGNRMTDRANRLAGNEGRLANPAVEALRKKTDAERAEKAWAAADASQAQFEAEAQAKLDDKFGKAGSVELTKLGEDNLFDAAKLTQAVAAGGLGGNPLGLLGAVFGQEKGALDGEAKAERDKERKLNGFGAGFGGVTTGDAFWSDAQSKIMADDDTAKQALEEQKRTAKATEEAVSRLEDLVKLGGKPAGAIAKGRT